MNCGKLLYWSRKEAKASAKRLNMRNNNKKHVVYICDNCGFYHTTTMPKQQSRDLTRFKNKGK